MKPAAGSSKPRGSGLPTARANSAARSGSNCWRRGRRRLSSGAGRAERPPLSYPRRRLLLTAIRPYPLHHLLDMRDRGFRLNAVAEVEDQPAAGVVRQHVVDGAIERGAAGDQGERIEIALNGDTALHALA